MAVIRKPLVWTGWLALLLLLAALAAPTALRAYWWRRAANPVRRGAEIAARAGCLSCHGPHGTKGLPDPSTGEEVPPWDGGIPMMYVRDQSEVREYILDGVSKRRAANPKATADRLRAAIQMPAYRDVLTGRQVDDLVAYFMAASQMAPIVEEVASRGRLLVRQHRCESCHGVGGAGGVRNPGSLKGYIPGWLGDDFPDLVRDDAELRQWIQEGKVDRLLLNPIARHFLVGQRLQMPPYRAAFTPEETDAIVAYIHWLRQEPAR
jgi:mono/diheme cytochrome c family protein